MRLRQLTPPRDKANPPACDPKRSEPGGFAIPAFAPPTATAGARRAGPLPGGNPIATVKTSDSNTGFLVRSYRDPCTGGSSTASRGPPSPSPVTTQAVALLGLYVAGPSQTLAVVMIVFLGASLGPIFMAT